ncbi:MAG: GDP-mannose 4,6-dehydratase [Desulfobacterales bacterium]|nr:GDP-mannose 4,6-dehydratase [Desulfobacterales bacterium]
MKILITGGAGFIGSHLAELYLENGHDVYIIDNLSTGSLNNIKSFQLNDKFRNHLFVYIDTIFNKKKMTELIRKCDFIFHLAAAVGVEYILKHPLESINTNIQGTQIVLELCSKFNKKVLITSSSEVYGKHTHAPLVEDDNIIYGPSSKFRWSYAASKLMDEFTALAYYRTNGLNVIIVRLFNTVGQRQTGAYGMVMPRLITQALKNMPLTVYGDGLQTRTFTYVKDVAQGMFMLMESRSTVGEVFNIGGTEEISILKLAEKIIEQTGSASKIELIPYYQIFDKNFEDMLRRVPSVKKIYRYIGFKPETKLDTILSLIINDIKQ